jgi:hypothetical protein
MSRLRINYIIGDKAVEVGDFAACDADASLLIESIKLNKNMSHLRFLACATECWFKGF